MARYAFPTPPSGVEPKFLDADAAAGVPKVGTRRGGETSWTGSTLDFRIMTGRALVASRLPGETARTGLPLVEVAWFRPSSGVSSAAV
ncbi:MAG: hypothetical protein ACRYGP_03560 [Janthinobacterium lividum]